MKLQGLIKSALVGLKTNKSRSALTTLGIVIGVTAIILVMALGETAEKTIVNELGGLGAETVVIRPGQEPTGPSGYAEIFLSNSLKERELEALKKPANVPDLLDAAPEVLIGGSVAYKGETFRPVILGFDANFMRRALKMELGRGDLFNDDDIRSKAKVALIGQRVANELFGDQDPLGKFIEIKNVKFRVIGLYAQRGQVVFFNVDELVLVPYTSAQAFLFGEKHFHQIIARAKSPELVDRMVADIKLTLRELHDIADPKKDDFFIQTQQGLVQQVSSIISVFSIFLSLVVAISLVVGGIGIMNIMLVSVTERTREIGLRKAVGATNRNILAQFLLEAVFLTALGGLIGIILGALFAWLALFGLKAVANINSPFSFPWVGALIGFTVSAAVGVIFGLYPARQAAKKSPIEALRWE